VAAAVLHQPVPFKGPEWKHVSKDCVDFIASCLVRDFSCRMTVAEAMQHKWFRRFLPTDEHGQVLNNILPAAGAALPVMDGSTSWLQ
jgi:serine/threonine protein kinase